MSVLKSVNSPFSPWQMVAESLPLSTGFSRCMCHIKTPALSKFILDILHNKRLPINEYSALHDVMYRQLSPCTNHNHPKG